MNAFSVSSTLLGSINKQKKNVFVALLPCGGLEVVSVVEENRAVDGRRIGKAAVLKGGLERPCVSLLELHGNLSG